MAFAVVPHIALSSFRAGASTGFVLGAGARLNVHARRHLRRRTAVAVASQALSSSATTAPASKAASTAYGPGATGNALRTSDGEPLLHVVFVHPQIHWNSGNIGRTCLGLGARLHLVGPLGFSLDAAQVRRAGLDYWEHVDLRVYSDWGDFCTRTADSADRFFYTKFGKVCASDMVWPSDGRAVYLVFGSEVNGFDGIREWLDTHKDRESITTVAFPMVDDRFRSFNLSTTASMALWDAYKTLNAAATIKG